MSIETFSPVPLNTFGSWVTLLDPSDVPVGTSPSLQGVDFLPGGIRTRPGLLSTPSRVGGTPKTTRYGRVLQDTPYIFGLGKVRGVRCIVLGGQDGLCELSVTNSLSLFALRPASAKGTRIVASDNEYYVSIPTRSYLKRAL